MWLMTRASAGDDYVVGTGVTHSVRDFCARAFGCLGLDYHAYVREDAAKYRPTENSQLAADATKARRELGWSPEVSFDQLVEMMVQADMSANS
jgi:GDPmannose 4,6-dehydratase